MKPNFEQVIKQEGSRSIKGTSYLLEEPWYISCILSMLLDEIVFGRPSSVLVMARETRAFQQVEHEVPIQGWLNSPNLLF